MKRMTKSPIMIGTILILALLLGGCYWTPDEEEGGVTLNIERESLGASQTTEFNGFLFGYVIAGDLLSGDQAAADRAFEEVNRTFQSAFEQLQPSESTDDFQVSLSFPAIQLQLELLSGNSGTNTFGGLRAGREYLVTVFAFDSSKASSTYVGDVGFTAVAIEGGETQEVNLRLGNNWGRFYDFVEGRYGYFAERGAVEITMPASYSGFYLDLLDGSTPDISGSVSAWYSSPDVIVVNRNHDPIQKTNNRPSVPEGLTTYRIEGLAPNRAWRILFTDWADRSNTPGTAPSHLSIPFTTTEGQTSYLNFSQDPGDDFAFGS